jgi:hypothetical protein
MRKSLFALASACAALAMLGWICPQVLVRGLVHADPPMTDADVLPLSGDNAMGEAIKQLVNCQPACLLLVEGAPPRTVQVQAKQSSSSRRQQLSIAAGIEPQRIVVLTAESRPLYPLQVIEAWLRAHPQRRLRVLQDEFSSRQLRVTLDRRLDPALSQRIAIQPLPDRRYSIGKGWINRLGVWRVFDAYLSLARSLLGIRSAEPPRYLSPDEYEQAFLDSLGLAP